MSIVSTTTDKNGKQSLVVNTENNLDWYNLNTGQSGIREPATALTDVAREANNLSKMDAGKVAISIQDKEGNYSTYYPRETDRGDIALMPSSTDQIDKGKEPIYFNKKYELQDNGKVKRDDKTDEPLYFYIMNKDTDAAKDLLANIKINEFTRQNDQPGFSIATRVSLHNPDLLKEINEYQKTPDDNSKTIAVISKDGIEIATQKEFSERKAEKTAQAEKTQEATKSVDAGMDR